jgi:hypothetical protein
MTATRSAGDGHRITVAPKPLPTESWLHEDRFAEFLAAYRYAAGHFSQAAPAFSKVTPEDAYWIWKTITAGVERNRRVSAEQEPATPSGDAT